MRASYVVDAEYIEHNLEFYLEETIGVLGFGGWEIFSSPPCPERL